MKYSQKNFFVLLLKTTKVKSSELFPVYGIIFKSYWVVLTMILRIMDLEHSYIMCIEKLKEFQVHTHTYIHAHAHTVYSPSIIRWYILSLRSLL